MVGRRDAGLHRRRSGPGQDVEHDIGAGDPACERFGSGALHSVEAVDGNGGQDLDHLAVAIAALLQTAAQALQSWRQRELLERRAVPECARLLRQHRYVMPRIVDRLIATVAPRMLGNDIIALTDDDAGRIGVDLRRVWESLTRSEEHTSEIQSLMRISYAVFC